jgi:hypothetical protein
MKKLEKNIQNISEDSDSLYNLFTPLTTKKAIIFISIVGFIVFFNMFFNEFVWDDLSYIINYPLVHQISVSSVFGPNLFNIAGQYRPIQPLYFSILYAFFSTNPVGYHLIQLILHIVCASLLYFFYRRFVAPGIALFCAIVFLVHPMNVESVSYIAQAASPLLSVFGLTALFISAKKKLSVMDISAITVLSLLSLLTKETGLLFLILMVVYRFLFIRKNIAKLSVISLFVVIAYFFIRIFIGNAGLTTRTLTPIAGVSFFLRLLNMPIIFFYYLKTFFFPKILIIDQQWVISAVNYSTVYLPVISDILFFTLLIIIGIYLFKFQKNYFKPFLFFSIWFILGISMLLQIYPLDATVADRWFYNPVMGLIGIVAVSCQSILQKRIHSRLFPVILAVLIICSLSWRTIMRNTDWHDGITLYTHDIQLSDNYDIEMDLGAILAYNGEFTKALPHLKKSVASRPYEKNLYDLGIVYANLGNKGKAGTYLLMAIQTAPMHKPSLETDIGYSTILVFYDKNPQAVPFITNALKDYPASAALWINLAIAKFNQHNKQGALEAIAKAYAIIPIPQGSYLYNHIKNNESFKINESGKIFTYP